MSEMDPYVEVCRGARRPIQVLIRVLRDAGMGALEGRGRPGVVCKAQEGVVLVPSSLREAGVKLVEMTKKNYPAMFKAGSGRD